MASIGDEPDARSPDLILHHSLPEKPGRVHVVAIGVGEYNRNKLKYPAKDAGQISRYVPSHAVGRGQVLGTTQVLSEGGVTRKAVEDAFTKVRREVRGHPEDTVVVFLAGHTDILTTPTRDRDRRYSLLLQKYEFPASQPLDVAIRGPGVAALDRIAPEEAFLPYAIIYRNLIGLEALRRLVIVDACQAEEVLVDPGVQVVRQLEAMARDARQTRTDYFLASRRGEPASESSALEHGLLTYVLLKGMGATDLKPAPADVQTIFASHPTADADADGRITTGELKRYVAMTLPELSTRLAGVDRGPAGPARPAGPEPTIQGVGVSFPLVQLPPAGR